MTCEPMKHLSDLIGHLTEFVCFPKPLISNERKQGARKNISFFSWYKCYFVVCPAEGREHEFLVQFSIFWFYHRIIENSLLFLLIPLLSPKSTSLLRNRPITKRRGHMHCELLPGRRTWRASLPSASWQLQIVAFAVSLKFRKIDCEWYWCWL